MLAWLYSATDDNLTPPPSAPGDYNSLTSQLTFRAGQIEQCVDVTINIDDLTEGAEVFSGIITNDAGNPRVTLSPDEAVVTIVDVNGAFTIQYLLLYIISLINTMATCLYNYGIIPHHQML